VNLNALGQVRLVILHVVAPGDLALVEDVQEVLASFLDLITLLVLLL